MSSQQPASFTYHVTLTRSVIVRLVAYSSVLLGISFEIFWAIDWTMPALDLTTVAASVLVYVIALALHEWVHGVGMRFFGARPHYGLTVVRRVLPVAYTTAPGHRFMLSQMVIIGLAPLVTLSAAAVAVALLTPSLGYYAGVAFAGNFSGAVGDLWMVSVLVRFRRCRNVRVIDEKFGLAVESTDPSAPLVAATLERGGFRMTCLTVSSFVVLMALIWLGLPIADWLAPADASHLRVGPAWFPLFESTPEAPISVYPLHLLLASILLSLPTLLLPAPRPGPRTDRPERDPDAPGVPVLI
jgi:hypothetical protein